ncbi:hypothetical protein BDW22DRAFT_1478005 [Trametopsis cervina]|nr:hypothetical protein BDW22DRAFT_1478005 [Trametopsis cervina]
MPVTRRQSGALAVTTRKDAGNEPLDLTEEHLSDGELSELTDLESEDDVPLAKRRKTGAKPIKKTAILQLVPPKDLIKVACTSKVLWTTLSSLHTQGLWRASRENATLFEKVEIPGPPSHVSERRWAYLLFGQPRCYTCNAPGIYTVIAPLLRRACIACMKKNDELSLVWSSKFSSVFDGYDEKILAFIPYTNIGGFAHGHPSSSRFYWEDDVHAMAQQHGDLVKNVRLKKADAANQLVSFEASRVKLVSEMTQLMSKMQSWKEHLREQKDVVDRDGRAERLKELEHARNTRCDDQGLYRNNSHSEISDGSKITAWKPLLAKLEVLREEGKAQREDARVYALTRRFEQATGTTYRDWMSGVPPLRWASLPSDTQISQLPETQEALAELIRSPAAANSPLDVAFLTEWQSKLPAMTARWAEQQRQKVTSLISSTSLNTGALVSWFSFVLTESDTDVDSVCVFRCTNLECAYADDRPSRQDKYPSLIGIDEAVAHRCQLSPGYGRGEASIAFSPRGTEAFAALVRAASILVSRKTVLEMDEAEILFVCMGCPVHREQRCSGRDVMGWRQCISHYAVSGHRQPAWQLVNKDSASQFVTVHNRPMQRHRHNNGWACMRCPEHVNKQLDRPAVEEHLQTKHNVAARDVQVGVDLFWYPRHPHLELPSRMLPMGQQMPVVQQMPVGQQTLPQGVSGPSYRCLQCPGSKRLFVLIGVTSHCRDKHKIDPSTIQEGVHYVDSVGNGNK